VRDKNLDQLNVQKLMMKFYYIYYNEMIGKLGLVSDGQNLLAIDFEPTNRPNIPESREPFEKVVSQLDEYFAGQRHEFNLPIRMEGTPFQIRAWEALRKIPYGETISYKEQADRIGSHPRAVGLANGKNPIPIIVPCHRVIGSNGALVGFGGGLQRKRQLLDLEAKI
jgi:methylated-DNA-[protein]-cysteine S-methyltransferase